MLILGIETSCDETAFAVVEDGRRILSNVISSQVEVHSRYGGVVPEVASRQHMLAITPIYQTSLAEAGVAPGDLDAVAVTSGPGLAGSLLVGINYAKGLSLGLGAPLYGMNHLEGHMYAGWLEEGSTPEEAIGFPLVCLLVSGGHTELVLMRGHGNYQLLGSTRDDAAGEAFDKVARLLSLPYPGGPALAELARNGDPGFFHFPRPLKGRGLDFSFSGLKTAVNLKLKSLEKDHGQIEEGLSAHIAASFQAAVVDTLTEKALRALEETGLETLVVAGGVGANEVLRKKLAFEIEGSGGHVYYPRPQFCTDNGAMIAYAGWCRRGDVEPGVPQILARPRWPLDELKPPN